MENIELHHSEQLMTTNDKSKITSKMTPDEKENMIVNMRKALQTVGYAFIENLKSDIYREAIDKVDVDSITENEFCVLIAERMKILDDFERKEFIRTVEKDISSYDDEVFSLRESIMLTLQAMIKSHNYRANNSL